MLILCFHSEQYVNQVPNLHYESHDSYFVFPVELIEKFYMIGKTDGKVFFSLPQDSVNENQVYDKGK